MVARKYSILSKISVLLKDVQGNQILQQKRILCYPRKLYHIKLLEEYFGQ